MSDRIEPGTTVFLDAYEGITSVLVCNEVFHRSMIAEIVEKQNISPGSVLRCLKENPGIVKESIKAWAAMEKIRQIKHLKIAGIDEDTLELALGYSKMYGLLSNDAFHLGTMKQEGVITMASNDRDFECVEWINLWRP